METDQKTRPQPILTVMADEGRRITWLAGRIGYSSEYLSRVFNGHLPALPRLRALCALTLGRAEADLFFTATPESNAASVPAA